MARRTRCFWFLCGVVMATYVSQEVCGAAGDAKQPTELPQKTTDSQPSTPPARPSELPGNTSEIRASTAFKQISGKILSIDPQRQIVLLEVQGAEAPPVMRAMRFAVDEQTTISEVGRRLRLGDLEIGRQVTIQYVMREGERRAHSIVLEEIPTRG